MADGQQIDSGQGDVSPARLVNLRSRKSGGGSTSRLLMGEALVASTGSILGGPGAVLTGSSLAFQQGAFTKQTARLLSGTSVGILQGNVLGPAPSSLQIDYSSAEGTAVDAASGTLYWQSGFETVSGTLIDWGNGGHGHTTPNGVREYDPAAKAQSWVYATANYGTYAGVVPTLNPGGPEFPAGAIPVTQHDNYHYLYIPAIDSLVIPTRGQYHRPSSTWKLANRAEVRGPPATVVGSGASQFASGRADDTGLLGWAAGPTGAPVVGTDATSLFRPYGSAMLSGPGYVSQYTDDYNPHQAWSKQFNAGVRISGATPGRQYLWVIAPSANFGTGPQPYVVFRKDMPPTSDNPNLGLSGQPAWLAEGRDGCCFAGEYVYWVGGWYGRYALPEAPDVNDHPFIKRPWFFRMKITPHLFSISTPLDSGEGRIERLPDVPNDYILQGGRARPDYWVTVSQTTLRVTDISNYGPWHYGLRFPLLRHDPYSNALLLISESGLAMFDLRTLAWTNLNGTPAGLEYTAYWSATKEQKHPDCCVGDFIDTRSGQALRRFYWRAGGNDTFNNSIAVNGPTKKITFQSLKITRPADNVSYLSVEARNPENDAALLGTTGGIGPLRSIKHSGLVVNGDYLYLWSGDWDDQYPHNSTTTAGYKPEGVITQNGRQEIWRTQVSEAVSSGTSKWRLIGNAYAEYPWTGSAGYYAGATKGPFMPDGLGMFADSSGQLWMGPCDVGYSDLNGFEIAGQKTDYAAMYKWAPPGYNNTAVTGAGVNGVALGNGWTLPNQSKLQAYGVATGYDAGLTASGCVGWGRPNKGPAYDPTDNKARVVNVTSGGTSGARTYTVSVSEFNCTPDGTGKHLWTRQSVTVPITQMGSPPQSVVTSVNTGWGPGGIGNTCQIGRTLYFSLMTAYGVNDGSGNAFSDTLKRGHIIAVNLDAFPATSSISYIPLPQQMNWWLRPWDGPEAAYGQSTNAALTPGQYRSMVAVPNQTGDTTQGKLVIGPDRWHKIGVDPWICAWDTAKKTWTTFAAPTNSDWPNTLMGLVSVPALGEAWLCGTPTLGDFNSTECATFGWYDPKAHFNATGQHTGRRIVRFKVT